MSFLSDTRDLVGINRPQDIKHFQYVRRGLLILGAWPGKLLGEDEKLRLPYQIWNIFITMFCFVGTGLYVKNNFGILSFFDMGQSYITELMGFVTTTRAFAILFRSYDKSLQYFLKEIHLFHFKEQSSYAMKTYLFIHKLSHFFIIYSFAIIVWTAIFFNIPPLYNNISNGGFSSPLPTNFTYEHSAFYSLPFDYQHEIKGFLVIFIFNWYASLMYAIIFSVHDLKLVLYVFHLWGHLKIVIYNLENFPRPALEGSGKVVGLDGGSETYNESGRVVTTHYSDEELVDVAKRLKDIIRHHELILRFTTDISNTYGLSVFIFYAFEQVTLCLLLLECSQMNAKALIRFGPLTIGLLQLLVQTSVVFELLSSKNEPLMRAAYNVPWECMDTKNRRLVRLMLMQTQIPLGLKAMGLVEVGCQTMAAIIKTTVSYFVMLRTIATDE